jgi:simple sugar transport system ATP-binding protein
LAGVSGNGQVELFDALVGVRPALEGQIILDGEVITNKSPAEIMKKGVASVPQDRLKQGLIGEFSLQENVILGFHGDPPFCSKSLLNWKKISAFATEAISQFDIAAQGPDQKVEQLSGGNLQKVILAREVSKPVKALIASSPTRGLDINATYYVYQRFLELLKTGAGILLISEDLDEIFNVADRIAVIFNGRIMGLFNAHEADKGKIGMLMTGIKEDE